MTHSLRTNVQFEDDRSVPSPKPEAFFDAFRKPETPAEQRLHEGLTRGRSPIGPAPVTPTLPGTIPAPTLESTVQFRKRK